MTGLSLYNFRSNFLDLENDVICVFCGNDWEERRRIERMMSICLTWFPIGGLGEPNIYQNLVYFTRIGNFTWRVSDCEELVGVTWRVSDCEELSGGFLTGE